MNNIRQALESPLTALASIWVAAALMVLGAPDMVSGSQHEHLPLALITVWLWAAAATAFASMTPSRGSLARWTLGVAGLWVATALIAVTAPVMVTGSDPTRIPLAVIIAPPVAAVLTGMLSLRQASLPERPPGEAPATQQGYKDLPVEVSRPVPAPTPTPSVRTRDPDREATMRKLLVLGAGTAGTMIANKLRRRLDRRDWTVTVVDRDDEHHYQPGYLFIPFGTYDRDDVVRSRHRFLADGIDLVLGEVDRVEPEANACSSTDGRTLAYDYLVIATGTTPRPDQTPGMLGPEWRRSIFDFYTLEGAEALAGALRELRPRAAGRAHHRDADQVPGRPAGVRVPGRGLAPRARACGTSVEIVLRDAPRRSVHPADRLRPPGRHARGAQDRRRDRLHGRADRPESRSAGVVRRARGALRPARDGAAQHGCRLRRPVRTGRRAQLRAGRQAHAAVDEVRQHLRHRRRRRTSRPPRPGRWPTSPSRCSSRTSSSTSHGLADDRIVRRPRQLLRRVRRRARRC